MKHYKTRENDEYACTCGLRWDIKEPDPHPIEPQVVADYPPNIDAIREVFPLPKGVIFTYGHTIYNPAGVHLDRPLIAHESVHMRQQGDDPAAWWERYLIDPEWRLQQELEAHRVEWHVFRIRCFSREKRNRFLFGLATRLASPMYGKLITIKDATREIKK